MNTSGLLLLHINLSCVSEVGFFVTSGSLVTWIMAQIQDKKQNIAQVTAVDIRKAKVQFCEKFNDTD